MKLEKEHLIQELVYSAFDKDRDSRFKDFETEVEVFSFLTEAYDLVIDDDGDVIAINSKNDDITYCVGLSGFDCTMHIAANFLGYELGLLEAAIVKGMITFHAVAIDEAVRNDYICEDCAEAAA
jgi:hypothetical protein